VQVLYVVNVQFNGALEDTILGVKDNSGHVDGHLIGYDSGYLTHQSYLVDTPQFDDGRKGELPSGAPFEGDDA